MLDSEMTVPAEAAHKSATLCIYQESSEVIATSLNAETCWLCANMKTDPASPSYFPAQAPNAQPAVLQSDFSSQSRAKQTVSAFLDYICNFHIPLPDLRASSRRINYVEVNSFNSQLGHLSSHF